MVSFYQDDVEVVYEKLNERVQDLSTFDEYAAEVRSGRLEWSPVHKSEKFWVLTSALLSLLRIFLINSHNARKTYSCLLLLLFF